MKNQKQKKSKKKKSNSNAFSVRVNTFCRNDLTKCDFTVFSFGGLCRESDANVISMAGRRLFWLFKRANVNFHSKVDFDSLSTVRRQEAAGKRVLANAGLASSSSFSLSIHFCITRPFLSPFLTRLFRATPWMCPTWNGHTWFMFVSLFLIWFFFLCTLSRS